MLEHGGRLRRAAQAYNIPLAHWLDLSTGVSPFAWPVPAIPEHAWQRLPEDDDGLAECAAAYYGAPQVLPVAGSQAAIQALPLLRARPRRRTYAWLRRACTGMAACRASGRADERGAIAARR